jgi:DNA-binding PadR family transcriptional regulator
MSVEYTILGVVIEAPSHGYSIKKHLVESYSKDFGLNDGQLYPALSRLESRGWITKEVVPQRTSPARHLYHATAEGRKAFNVWLREAYPAEGRARYDYLFKNDFLQKCGFFHHLDPREVELLAGRKLEDVTRRLADLEGVLQRMEAGDVEPCRRMVVEYGIRYQRMWRAWLDELLAQVAGRELTRAASGRPAAPEHVPADPAEGEREHV